MELTGREAARRLQAGLGISRDHARRVLAAGLAGEPVRYAGHLGYSADAVTALAAQEPISAVELDRLSPFIARLGRSRVLTTDQTWDEQAAIVAENWYVPSITGVWLRLHTPLPDKRIPLVATIANLVAFGAEVTGFHHLDTTGVAVRSRRERPLTWHLAPPGDWFRSLQRGWLPLPPGPAWAAWGAPTAGIFETVYSDANRPA